ncbi:NEL-type E3 ubiquitin ligase domain-containing protein [Pseudomonas sp. NPDC089996]|uniref:NEL-type E3 ubiquitin ligase domain-containing protein n=1 Tax=Pseudomonas sp. NPDC089996 TaxID=3364474 RepID=UPI00382510E0
MRNQSSSAPDFSGSKLDTATDTFIGTVLPDWLKRASPAQINRLRDSFKRHHANQASLRAATSALIPLQRFAEETFGQLLKDRLPSGTELQTLQWLQVRRDFSRLPGIHWPIYGPTYDRQPALLRLMQNFHEDAEVLAGSGLVSSGTGSVLSGDPEQLARDCRRWDVGARYQTLLERTFTPATHALLAGDKRAGLLLALDVAALKGDLGTEVEAALRAVVQAGSEIGLRAYPGLLTMLGCPISDALAFQLRGPDGEQGGVVLYLPSDPKRALRYFESWEYLNGAMAEALRQKHYRSYFSQLVALQARAGFLSTLEKRLQDDVADLQLDALTGEGDAFERLVAQQVKRAKDDARLLLVPTADADLRAARDRLQAWESAGFGLLNLAGLFIPVVGALLLGQLVVQTLSEVYEGAADWYHGHQHEALEHMLGVAEALAVTAVVATGATILVRGFQRSAFVDGLEPVALEGGHQRLWQRELKAYEVTPFNPSQGRDGLFEEGDRKFLRVGERFYLVHRPEPDGPWRVRHPERVDAFGPEVEFNGDRGWRLRHERPLECDDNARMLDMLWPQRVPLSTQRASDVMRVAGIDSEGLRGLMVTGRQLPVSLRETLRRFEADARIDAFFEQMQREIPAADDLEIQQWCLAQPALQGLDAQALRVRVLERQASLGEQLLAHLTQTVLAPDGLRDLVRRDFPGLSPTYCDALVQDVSAGQRERAVLEQRLPLSVSSQARSLLQQSRLTRALEGLYLGSSYSDQTGELVLAMLPRLPHWPRGFNLELREGSESGRRLAVIDPQAAAEFTTVIVRRDGEMRLYDSHGLEREEEIATPCGLFEAIVACLSPTELTRLDIAGHAPAGALRALVVQRLPATRAELLNLLGWRSVESGRSPLRRLSDGRIGYPLSGRGQGQRWAERNLRNRIRELYWGLSDAQADAFLSQFLLLPGSPYTNLLSLEREYGQVDLALNRWSHAELNDTRRNMRQRVGALMRRAWRLQGESAQGADGIADGVCLDFSGLPLRTLPELPTGANFGNVTELNLAGLELSGVPSTFLSGFRLLRRLNLNYNALLRIPTGITRFTRLTDLSLASNRIRMDLDGTQALARLAALRHLDLSFNPLGSIALRFNQLSQLRSVGLRRCGLLLWPEGLENCGFLDSADIRQNQISRVPEQVLLMPRAFRNAFRVNDNPLSVTDRERLFAERPHQHFDAVPPQFESLPVEANGQSRERWLQAMAQDSRETSAQDWDRLLAIPGSTGLFRLLGDLARTRDYRVAPEYLAGQVRELLLAIGGDDELRLQVFERAGMAVTCVDSVAGRFSDLQVLMLTHQAARGDAGPGRASELLSLGRQLFRLDELARYARDDTAQRIARLPPAESAGYASARAAIDDIEIDLYYRVHLATELDLPLQPRHMQFEGVANVTSAQLQQALQRVRAAEDSQALARSISQREFWLNHLRTEHPQAFTAIEDGFADRGSNLDEQQTALSSEDYLQRWNALRIERDAQLHDLAVQLTQEALDRHAVSQG